MSKKFRTLTISLGSLTLAGCVQECETIYTVEANEVSQKWRSCVDQLAEDTTFMRSEEIGEYLVICAEGLDRL